MEKAQVEIQENKMGTMPVNRLIISMSLPMMISMLVQALYNIVDSIFVAMLSEDALTAVSMAFPIQSIMIALSGGMGVGVNAILSRSLGEKKQDIVNKSAMAGLFLSICNYIVMVVIGLTCIKPFYRLQTDSQTITAYGNDYLTIICCLSLGLFFQMITERLMQSTGKTIYSMITQSTGAIINIILDPIMIFGLAGFPKMGVKGAALATVCGQTIAGITGIIINLKKNTEIHFKLQNLKPDLKMIAAIYKIGLPSIIMQLIGSIMVFCLNKILIKFSSTAVAVFGVYFKLQSFIFLPVFGLNNGVIPIIAYNYGAQNKKRLTDTIKYAIIIAFSIMLVGLIIFEIIPDKLFMLFSASDNMLAMGRVSLRIIAIHFPIAAVCIVFGSTFQALGNAVYSMLSSIARQIVVLIPSAYLLSLIGNVDYVWFAFPIAEIISLAMSSYFMLRIKHKIIDKIPG